MIEIHVDKLLAEHNRSFYWGQPGDLLTMTNTKRPAKREKKSGRKLVQ